jgi:ubiquitin-conjugating enzyme E2 J1
MPPEYPMKPPDVYLLTPNGIDSHSAPPACSPRIDVFRFCAGRFQTGTKICLSYTSFHAEEWQPAWGVRTMLNALTGIFPIDQPGYLLFDAH